MSNITYLFAGIRKATSGLLYARSQTAKKHWAEFGDIYTSLDSAYCRSFADIVKAVEEDDTFAVAIFISMAYAYSDKGLVVPEEARTTLNDRIETTRNLATLQPTKLPKGLDANEYRWGDWVETIRDDGLAVRVWLNTHFVEEASEPDPEYWECWERPLDKAPLLFSTLPMP